MFRFDPAVALPYNFARRAVSPYPAGAPSKQTQGGLTVAIESVRVGLIGAGRNTRDRHIPGFNTTPGVEIGAVANRSRESGQRVADAFNIPTVYDSWEELLEDESLDAVCIGTWPYMHRTLTMASLAAGKHVLCEARMAMNASEAHDMLAASRSNRPAS